MAPRAKVTCLCADCLLHSPLGRMWPSRSSKTAHLAATQYEKSLVTSRNSSDSRDSLPNNITAPQASTSLENAAIQIFLDVVQGDVHEPFDQPSKLWTSRSEFQQSRVSSADPEGINIGVESSMTDLMSGIQQLIIGDEPASNIESSQSLPASIDVTPTENKDTSLQMEHTEALPSSGAKPSLPLPPPGARGKPAVNRHVSRRLERLDSIGKVVETLWTCLQDPGITEHKLSDVEMRCIELASDLEGLKYNHVDVITRRQEVAQKLCNVESRVADLLNSQLLRSNGPVQVNTGEYFSTK